MSVNKVPITNLVPNAPQSRGWDAEDRFHVQFRKVAKYAIEKLSMNLNTFAAHARDDFQEAKLELKVKACRRKVERSADEIAEEQWQARLKRIEHQERLGKRRKH